MIYLHFPEENTQVRNWRERLDNLIVGYKVECVPALMQPVIMENQTQFAGAEAIEKFLQELEAEVNDWRTPRCGV